MDARTDFLHRLSGYRHDHPEEEAVVARFESFIRAHGDAFLRSCAPGHVTGSALVVSSDLGKTLLVHHRKLDRWLQPGGHCEPGEDALKAAVREAVEETGVIARPWDGGRLFDLDIHGFPARGQVPAHLHYDARFLLVAESGNGYAGELARASEESHAVEWVSMEEAIKRNPEESMARMARKIRAILASQDLSPGGGIRRA